MRNNWPLNLLILILAAYRAARLLAIDAGPLRVFENVRLWVGQQAHKEQQRKPFGPWQSLGEGINCVYCTGVWMAILLFLLSLPDADILNAGIYMLAIAGGQALFQGVTNATE